MTDKPYAMHIHFEAGVLHVDNLSNADIDTIYDYLKKGEMCELVNQHDERILVNPPKVCYVHVSKNDRQS